MTKVTVKFKGEVLTKATKRTDVTHVVVSLHKGKREISGMFSSRSGAEARVSQGWNPAWTDHAVVEVSSGVESGLTGEDWEPTEATRYYAQMGEKFEFGRTEDEARAKLFG